ncbi:MAG: hypothetical protein ACR2MN_14575 [Acidimicrobiales bacterium]
MIPGMEPNADARVFASNLRQMFVAMTAEGFTSAEALTILGTVLAASIAKGTE